MQPARKEKAEIKIWSTAYNLILGIGLLGIMGGALLGPVLPALLEPFGVTESRVGYVLAVYSFFTALSMPFLGPLIDKFGRKRMVIPCLVLNGVAGMLGAFAPNFTVLLVLRAFQGLGIAGLLPVAMTLISDFFEGPAKVKAMGYLSGTLAVGGALGPIIGGNLAMFSWRFPFLFYGISILLALAVYLWLPSTGSNSEISLLAFAANYKTIIKNKSFLVVAGFNFIMAFLMISLVTYLPLYLSISLGISEGMAGNILALQGLTGIIMAAGFKYIATRFNTTRLVVAGLFFTIAGLVGIPNQATTIGVAVSVLIFGFGVGIIMPLLNTLITDAVNPEYMGAAVSLFNTMHFAGQTAAPVVLGAISGLLGFSTAFYGAAVVSLIGIIIISFAGRHLPAI